MQAIQPKAFHYEAREYCEKYDVPMEDVEKVRCSMAVRELHKRMEPFTAMLVRFHPAMYSLNSNEPPPREYVELTAHVDEIRQREMESLGLTLQGQRDRP